MVPIIPHPSVTCRGKFGPLPVMPPISANFLGLMQDQLAYKLFEASLAGARALMSFWCGQTVQTEKLDGSIVSDADHAADAAVRKALSQLSLDAELVSEESETHAAAGDGTFLLLDPLDGTDEFLAHGREFCVCLAAIHRGRPVAGAIVAPALKRAWYAGASCYGVDLDDSLAVVDTPAPLHVQNRATSQPYRALVSRRNGDPRSNAALARCGVSSLVQASSAIKFGFLAEGKADILVRHGRTMAWDIAAGDAILAAAGGSVRGFDGDALTYNGSNDGFGNPPFIAVADDVLVRPVLQAVQCTN